MSISAEFLGGLYQQEGLDPPAVMRWPPGPEAEERRRLRAAAFSRNLAADPPPGLEWIRSHERAKYRPDLVVEGCRAVLVSALGYYREDEIDSRPPSGPQGRIARYARGRDYHRELGRRLRRIARKLESALPGEHFRAFTDIGPLDETWLAQESGLAFTGRNTLAILPKLGSWAVLGHIISTSSVETPPSGAGSGRPSPMACPEGCRRCIDACPPGALSLPGTLDAARCLSYLTIEHPGEVPPDLSEAAGDRVFGCDACQEVCPFNRRAQTTEVEGFLRDIAGPSVDLGELLRLKNHEDVARRFAGSPLMRAGRSKLVRSACDAAGNSGLKELAGALEKLLGDEDSAVALHARLALERLGR